MFSSNYNVSITTGSSNNEQQQQLKITQIENRIYANQNESFYEYIVNSSEYEQLKNYGDVYACDVCPPQPNLKKGWKRTIDDFIVPTLSVQSSIVETSAKAVGNEILRDTRTLGKITLENTAAWKNFRSISKYSGYAGKALGFYGFYDSGSKLFNDPTNPANWIKFGSNTGLLFMKANPYTFVIGIGWVILDQGGYIDDLTKTKN